MTIFENMTFTKTFFLICLVGLISCQKSKTNLSLNNLNNGELVILGHKGMGESYKYPGNTFEGVMPVLGIGAHGTELDVQMTKDSVLVLFHNDKLEPVTTCINEVSSYNFAQIANCKYHVFNQNIFVTSLDALLGRIENLTAYQFSFDCKLFDKEEDIDFSRAFF